MAHIYLVRHGQNLDNVERLLNGHRDRPLTQLGRQQATATADAIVRGMQLFNREGNPPTEADKDVKRLRHIDVVLASPLVRARHTADIIADKLGKNVSEMTELMERDYGDLSGIPLSEIPVRASGLLHTKEHTFFLDGPKVENYPTAYARAGRVIDYIDREFAGKTVLVVSHGDLAKMLLGNRRGYPWRDALLTPWIGNAEIVELGSPPTLLTAAERTKVDSSVIARLYDLFQRRPPLTVDEVHRDLPKG